MSAMDQFSPIVTCRGAAFHGVMRLAPRDFEIFIFVEPEAMTKRKKKKKKKETNTATTSKSGTTTTI